MKRMYFEIDAFDQFSRPKSLFGFIKLCETGNRSIHQAILNY